MSKQAQVFNVRGMKVSTRSSKPWKRKMAKKMDGLDE